MARANKPYVRFPDFVRLSVRACDTATVVVDPKAKTILTAVERAIQKGNVFLLGIGVGDDFIPEPFPSHENAVRFIKQQGMLPYLVRRLAEQAIEQSDLCLFTFAAQLSEPNVADMKYVPKETELENLNGARLTTLNMQDIFDGHYSLLGRQPVAKPKVSSNVLAFRR